MIEISPAKQDNMVVLSASRNVSSLDSRLRGNDEANGLFGIKKTMSKSLVIPQCVVVADLSALVSIPHAACCVVDCLPLVQPRPTPDNSAWASAHSGLRTFSACGCAGERAKTPSPQSSDGTTSHSTRRQGRQVAGYPASGRGGEREEQLPISVSLREFQAIHFIGCMTHPDDGSM